MMLTWLCAPVWVFSERICQRVPLQQLRGLDWIVLILCISIACKLALGIRIGFCSHLSSMRKFIGSGCEGGGTLSIIRPNDAQLNDRFRGLVMYDRIVALVDLRIVFT